MIRHGDNRPTVTSDHGPCLACRRGLSARVQKCVNGKLAGPALFVCIGHPPQTFARVRRMVHDAQARGFRLVERFGTFRCPGCGCSYVDPAAHQVDSDECRDALEDRVESQKDRWVANAEG